MDVFLIFRQLLHQNRTRVSEDCAGVKAISAPVTSTLHLAQLLRSLLVKASRILVSVAHLYAASPLHRTMPVTGQVHRTERHREGVLRAVHFTLNVLRDLQIVTSAVAVVGDRLAGFIALFKRWRASIRTRVINAVFL